jgi:hypothetical protein
MRIYYIVTIGATCVGMHEKRAERWQGPMAIVVIARWLTVRRGYLLSENIKMYFTVF